MKKTALVFLTFVFLLTAVMSASAQPELTIPEPEFDFGYVPQHSSISHVFWLHSTGTDELKIANVRPG